MIRIEYCAEGEAVSDFGVEEWMKKVWVGGDFKVSTELPITRERVAVCEGELFPENVLFVFGELEQHPTRNGRLHHWPDGFCDIDIKLRERLL